MSLSLGLNFTNQCCCCCSGCDCTQQVVEFTALPDGDVTNLFYEPFGDTIDVENGYGLTQLGVPGFGAPTSWLQFDTSCPVWTVEFTFCDGALNNGGDYEFGWWDLAPPYTDWALFAKRSGIVWSVSDVNGVAPGYPFDWAGFKTVEGCQHMGLEYNRVTGLLTPLGDLVGTPFVVTPPTALGSIAAFFSNNVPGGD